MARKVTAVFRVQDIVRPRAGSSGYAVADVAADETEPEWLNVEVWVDAFTKPDTIALAAVESEFSPEGTPSVEMHGVGEFVVTYTKEG